MYSAIIYFLSLTPRLSDTATAQLGLSNGYVDGFAEPSLYVSPRSHDCLLLLPLLEKKKKIENKKKTQIKKRKRKKEKERERKKERRFHVYRFILFINLISFQFSRRRSIENL